MVELVELKVMQAEVSKYRPPSVKDREGSPGLQKYHESRSGIGI